MNENFRNILSVCIPTFNRADALTQTLIRLDTEFPKEVIFVIQDNASTDDTMLKVDAWCKAHPDRTIIYHRNESNIGIDLNIQTCALLVDTEWVHFFGDDDDLEPGSTTKWLPNLIEWNQQQLALIYFNYAEWDVPLRKQYTERQIQLHQDELFEPGCRIVEKVGEKLPLISSLLVKRKPFIERCKLIPPDIRQNGVGFVHALLGMTQQTRSLFLADPVVRWNRGSPERGFSWKKTVVEDLFAITKLQTPNSLDALRNHTLHSQIIPRSRNASLIMNWLDRLGLVRFLIPYYWRENRFWTGAIPRLLMPRPLFEVARRLTSFGKNSSGTAPSA